MTIEQAMATLVKEPYGKSFAEIGKLTPYQIRRILFAPSDKEGRPLKQEKHRARPRQHR
jgi:hypothetical protein